MIVTLPSSSPSSWNDAGSSPVTSITTPVVRLARPATVRIGLAIHRAVAASSRSRSASSRALHASSGRKADGHCLLPGRAVGGDVVCVVRAIEDQERHAGGSDHCAADGKAVAPGLKDLRVVDQRHARLRRRHQRVAHYRGPLRCYVEAVETRFRSRSARRSRDEDPP